MVTRAYTLPSILMAEPHSWHARLSQDVAKGGLLEAQLLALTFATGILDAATFATYHVFTSKQTGNTFFLALYAFDPVHLGPRAILNVVVSIVSFTLGGFCFSQVAPSGWQRRRGWLIASNAFQTVLVLIATVLQISGGSAVAIIALLSFASSGQIAMAASVGMPELNTTMVTSTLIQLSHDPYIFYRHNPARTRRLLVYISFLVGSSVGAAAARRRTPTLGLLLTGAVKTGVTTSLLWNQGIARLPIAR
ncbi:hypothetical protein LTR56_003809 [Elasticomyces elasticus]|nr:hypothetical protein LTR22_013130 [Elasticomyces elasticus]KAK3654951.1 hypothetical protein LTR56_003809 [Elasticomyces elasticus]KAK4928717.1 hypothetical protein LTR49_004526 [Elasticomyces elasticus]KAK5766655.1 hypothetical protein LTS12_003274 [Elasticomyces elasticus]